MKWEEARNRYNYKKIQKTKNTRRITFPIRHIKRGVSFSKKCKYMPLAPTDVLTDEHKSCSALKIYKIRVVFFASGKKKFHFLSGWMKKNVGSFPCEENLFIYFPSQ